MKLKKKEVNDQVRKQKRWERVRCRKLGKLVSRYYRSIVWPPKIPLPLSASSTVDVDIYLSVSATTRATITENDARIRHPLLRLHDFTFKAPRHAFTP